MADIKGTTKDTMHRLVITGHFDQKAPMTGVNVALRMANDTLTKKDVEAGKGQSAPMLVYDHYNDANGEKKTSFTAAYSREQFDAMMAAANTSGDKPVIEAQVFPRDNKLLVNTKSLATPKKAYDYAKDEANTKRIREIKAANREKAAQAQAQAQEQTEAQVESEAEAGGPELG